MPIYKCEYCNKTFSRRFTLERHITTDSCKVINTQKDILQEKIKYYEDELQEKIKYYEDELQEKIKYYEDELQEKIKYYEDELQEKIKYYEDELQEKIKYYEDVLQNKDLKLNECESELKYKDLLIQNKDAKIKEYENELKYKDVFIKSLEKQLYSVVNTIANKPTTYTTYNNSNNTNKNNSNNKTKTQILIQNLKPLTQEKINSSMSSLNLDIMLRGPDGYSEWAHENFLKDSVICTDYSRGILRWKNAEEILVKDPQGVKLKKFIFEAIQTENNDIIRNELLELSDKLQENSNDVFTSEIIVKKLNDLYQLSKSITKCASGESCKFSDKFIKNVCTRVNDNNDGIENDEKNNAKFYIEN